MTPSVRLAHLGLGNFFRAHQAWYTQHADGGSEWPVAAFSGRRPGLAASLDQQDGRYTLVTRGAQRDDFEVISSIARAYAATDHRAWRTTVASPAVAAVTITVTESAYLRSSGGRTDHEHPALRADVEALGHDISAGVSTVPARLVAGLLARRAADAGPIAIVPCDNLPGNGRVIERAVRDVAELVDPTLRPWLDDSVSFVTSMVDRITPATTGEHRRLVADATGWADRAPVVTEPFTEWVLSGAFPAGRPVWESAGAKFTNDVEPFERRKLWLLNGAHSLLAYAAPARGHELVADAIDDPVCRGWVTRWWEEAAAHLDLPDDEITAYRAALLERFANPRMHHRLDQIAADGSQKIAVRIVPTLHLERAAGRSSVGATRAIAGWLWHLRERRDDVRDIDAAAVIQRADGPLDTAVTAVLSYLDPALADDAVVVQDVRDQAVELGTR